MFGTSRSGTRFLLEGRDWEMLTLLHRNPEYLGGREMFLGHVFPVVEVVIEGLVDCLILGQTEPNHSSILQDDLRQRKALETEITELTSQNLGN